MWFILRVREGFVCRLFLFCFCFFLGGGCFDMGVGLFFFSCSICVLLCDGDNLSSPFFENIFLFHFFLFFFARFVCILLLVLLSN